MVLLSWIVVGAIADWLSRQMMKGRGSGLRGDIVVGVAGGMIGGFVAVIVFQVPNAAKATIVPQAPQPIAWKYARRNSHGREPRHPTRQVA